MKYFVTHGQGLDPFVLNELTNKFKTIVISIDDDQKYKGKVLFNAEKSDNSVKVSEDHIESNLQISQLLLSSLKTVERLFGFIYSNSDIDSTLLTLVRKPKLSLQALYDFCVKITPSISELLEEFAIIQSTITEGQERQEQADRVEGDLETLPKRRRKTVYSFRVDVKITGKYRQLLDSYQAARSIGAALLKNLPCPKSGRWEVDLKNPQMTVSFYVTDDGFLCGIPLTQQSIQTQSRTYSCPLSERNYLNTTPMRSTLCYILSSLVVADETEEAESLLILDPMSGSCLILIELVKNFPQVLLACGIDNSLNQMKYAATNIDKAKVAKNVSTILGDSTKLVFHENIIFDGVVCDLPFGLQHGTHDSVVETLPLIFKNIEKVVKASGNIVLLISLAMSAKMENIIVQNCLTWTLIEKYPVKLGTLQAVIYHYKKPSSQN